MANKKSSKSLPKVSYPTGGSLPSTPMATGTGNMTSRSSKNVTTIAGRRILRAD